MKHILMIGRGQRYVMRHQIINGHHGLIHHFGRQASIQRELENVSSGDGRSHSQRKPDGSLMQKKPIKFKF